VTGRKLLLADDSVTIQKVVNLTFADEGIEVVTVGDGDSALEKLGEFSPDLILADVNMPGASGYEICERVKHGGEFRSVPVILLVGSFEHFDEGRAQNAGADGHLTKPFQSIRQLVIKVTELLNAPAAPAETTDHNFEKTIEMSHGAVEYGDAELDDELIQTQTADAYTLGSGAHPYETKDDLSVPAMETQPLSAADLRDISFTSHAVDHAPVRPDENMSGQYSSSAEPNPPVLTHPRNTDDFDLLELPDFEDDEADFGDQTDAPAGGEFYESPGANGNAKQDPIPSPLEEYVSHNGPTPAMPETNGPAPFNSGLSPEAVNDIARRVVEMLSDKVLREIAREIVPRMAETIVRQVAEEKLRNG
jgi:CheY-like chemotaxis protein